MDTKSKLFLGGAVAGLLCVGVSLFSFSFFRHSLLIRYVLEAFPGFIFGLLVVALSAGSLPLLKKIIFIFATTVIYYLVMLSYSLLIILSQLSGGQISDSQVIVQAVASAVGATATIFSLRILGGRATPEQISRVALLGFFIGLIVPIPDHGLWGGQPHALVLFPVWQSAIAACCGWVLSTRTPQLK